MVLQQSSDIGWGGGGERSHCFPVLYMVYAGSDNQFARFQLFGADEAAPVARQAQKGDFTAIYFVVGRVIDKYLCLAVLLQNGAAGDRQPL